LNSVVSLRYGPRVLRVVDSPAVLERAAKIAEQAQREPVAVQIGATSSHEQMVSATLRAIEGQVAFATLTPSLDQTSFAITELARALPPTDRVAIDAALRDAPSEGIEAALTHLDAALQGRLVVLDHVERLAAPSTDEASAALEEHREHFKAWARTRADLVFSDGAMTGWRRHSRLGGVYQAQPFALQNGAAVPSLVHWEPGSDADAFALALAAQALDAPALDPDDAHAVAPAAVLRDQLWSLLPDEATSLLVLLATHGRPLSVEVFERVDGFDSAAANLGAELALWRVRGGEVAVDAGWIDWCRSARPPVERRAARRRLADALTREVNPDDASAALAGLSCLEAQRHLLALHEVEHALRYARYGLESFVAAARDLSLDHQYAEAAALYERLLVTPERLPRRLRGYARHYLHFNRAHARPEMEPVAETAKGYDAALSDWPENAIFRSRCVRAWYLAQQPERAREQLRAALADVPDHPDKRARLIARTARRLAEHEHFIDGAEVWNGYAPDTARAWEDARHFEARLERGWRADRLQVPGVDPLFLLRDDGFRIVRTGSDWRFIAEQLGRSERHATPIEAARDFVRSVSDEVKLLLRTLDRELDDEQRRRKHTLLSLVDVIASRLDAPAGDRTWVYGRVERDPDGLLWLVTEGNVAARYEITEPLASKLVVSPRNYLAEVTTDSSGVPRGPVLSVEPLSARDPEAVLREWRSRLAS